MTYMYDSTYLRLQEITAVSNGLLQTFGNVFDLLGDAASVLLQGDDIALHVGELVVEAVGGTPYLHQPTPSR